MKKNYRIILTSLFVLFFALTGFAEKTTIEKIINSPSKFDGEAVEIEGLVSQYIPSSSSSTAYYLIKGDFGGQIRVNTSDVAPETNTKYRVVGIVYYDTKTRSAFISEKSRSSLASQPSVIYKDSEGGNNNTLIYVIVIGVIVLIVILIYLSKNKSKKNNIPQSTPSSASVAAAKTHTPSTPTPSSDDDFKTIKINVNASSDPKTLKFIPGELKITAGGDKGKSFKIAGYPTPDGNIVTIGREVVSGERQYAHIQLMEKTVSRKQAQIIQKDGKLKVKNLSETNFTTVDGIELKPGEEVEIKPNSTVRTGEVEFQYIK